MNIIDVQDLTKIYQTGMRKGGIVALDGVNLSVEHGEIFGLLGPNGAGKTTLFKVLLNITNPNSGSCMISGLAPSDPNSRKKIGYLPENYRFPNHLTGLELLEITIRLYGFNSSEFTENIDNLLELVGMEKWKNSKLKKYSKGMLQRIGLAQAMVTDPDILFLDEPTDGVDPVGRMEIKDIMKKIRDDGKSIILNTHLLSEVEMVADRVAILMNGKVARIGSVEELTSKTSHYEIEADFGHKFVEIPEKFGKRLSISTKSMLVELKELEYINDIIDLIRIKKISIRSVKPLKISLEQSFIETVSGEGTKE
ncbi:MAG: ABC transporter ATP-binding protein [Candidatus Zixiibacteriota bacterium]|nr:MAG: ABC transporter ATP-binding protein [candidate division Zixibacteria bacterium]